MRNKIYTPWGIFPMRKAIYEENQKKTDLEVLENLFMGDMVVPELLTEAISRGLCTGFETREEIDSMIHELKTGQPNQSKPKTVMDLLKKFET
jgi:hypothetical protein